MDTAGVSLHITARRLWRSAIKEKRFRREGG
jgi:hypothetical protein